MSVDVAARGIMIAKIGYDLRIASNQSTKQHPGITPVDQGRKTRHGWLTSTRHSLVANTLCSLAIKWGRTMTLTLTVDTDESCSCTEKRSSIIFYVLEIEIGLSLYCRYIRFGGLISVLEAYVVARLVCLMVLGAVLLRYFDLELILPVHPLKP